MEQNKKRDKKLYRSSENRFIFGVCGGLGEYFGVDPLIFRIIFIGLTISAGSGIFLYLLMAVLIPKRSSDNDGDKTKSENAKERIGNLVSEAKSIFNSETGSVGGEGKKSDCCKRGFWRSFFGWTILIVGAIFLAKKTGILSDSGFIARGVLRFWPLILVFIGWSILSRGAKIGRFLGLIVFLFFVFLVVGFFVWPSGPIAMHASRFDIPMSGSTIRGDITLEAGAVDMEIKGGEDDSFSGELVSGGDLKTASVVAEDGETQKILISMTGRKMMWRNWQNSLNVNMAEGYPLDIKIKTGASNLNMDATDIELNHLGIDAGASRLKVVFGDKSDNATVDIRAGASSIDLVLPESVGAALEIKGGLLDRDLPGFSKKGEHSYESENYSDADKKISIKIDAGVSKISVSRK